MTKTLVEPNPMVAGQPATWRLTVVNNGPSVADNVVISDAVPANMTFVSAQIEGGRACPVPELIDEQTIVRCPVGELAVGATASAMVTFQIDALAPDELCNATLVGSGSLDPASDDNEAESCNPVVPPPPVDVGVALTPVDPTLASGDEASYTAVVRNNGPGPATGVVLTIETPAWFTDFSGVLIDASDGTSPQVNCVVGSLICTVGNLEPGQQVRYRIAGIVSGEPGQQLTLTGTVTHNEIDTEPANDTAAATIRIQQVPPPTTGPTTSTTGPTTSTTLPLTVTTRPPSDGGGFLPTTGSGAASVAIVAALLLAGGIVLRSAGWRRSRRQP